MYLNNISIMLECVKNHVQVIAKWFKLINHNLQQIYLDNVITEEKIFDIQVMMVYMMPAMMLFWFNDYASGLCYYYFLSQIFTMIIMFVIRRTTNDEEIRAKLMARKPKKKSRFQERYEEALRQQQDHMTINREQRRQRH